MPGRFLLCIVVLCSSTLATGCAARSSAVAAGTPDERRQQIALLDQRIAAAEAELGLRWASPPPASRATVTGVPAEADAESPPGGEAGGMALAPTPEPMAPPPPAQAPGREEPTADVPMSPSPRAPGDGAGRCVRVCRSVLAICDASRRICRLAEDLEDDWAQGRCEAATRSCDNAEGRAASSCGDC